MLQTRSNTSPHHVNPVVMRNGIVPVPAKCEHLTPEDLEILAHGRCFMRNLEPGSTLLDQGSQSDKVYVLIDGWAFCYKMLEDGRRQILDLVLPGGIIGFDGGEVARYGVEAKTTCRVAVFNRHGFSATLLDSPALCLKCACLFASAESRALERLSRVGRWSAVERVSGLIVELARQLRTAGEKREGAPSLTLTQMEIADMLGLAKETVCRVLMSLRKEGFVHFRRGNLEIRNLAGLVDAAGDDEVEDTGERYIEYEYARPTELAA